MCTHCDLELSYSAWKCHINLYGGLTNSTYSEPQGKSTLDDNDDCPIFSDTDCDRFMGLEKAPDILNGKTF